MHDAGLTCACQAQHRPHPLELNLHHVQPAAMGGPSDEANLVALCPTSHVNTHELLRLMLKAGRPLLWPEVGAIYDVPVNRYSYRLALLGYRRVAAAVAS